MLHHNNTWNTERQRLSSTFVETCHQFIAMSHLCLVTKFWLPVCCVIFMMLFASTMLTLTILFGFTPCICTHAFLQQYLSRHRLWIRLFVYLSQFGLCNSNHHYWLKVISHSWQWDSWITQTVWCFLWTFSSTSTPHKCAQTKAWCSLIDNSFPLVSFPKCSWTAPSCFWSPKFCWNVQLEYYGLHQA